LARKAKARARNRAYLIGWKSQPCTDCGLLWHHVIMDVDHRGEKRATPKKLMLGSLERLKEELEVCEPRCSNCHRWRHHREREAATRGSGGS
jgi:hypothetical protein